jgi:predicted O-methyltransferase YrrM
MLVPYQKIDWKSISSPSPELEEFSKLEEWAYFKFLATENYETRRAIEIGSYHGRSTALLAQFFNVFAIDLWGQEEQGLDYYDLIGLKLFPFIENMKSIDLIPGRVHPVISTCHFLANIPSLEADLVFIDGDHRYEQCLLDAWHSDKHLKPGGFLIFHDFQRQGPAWPDAPTNDDFPGVQNAVRYFLEHFPNYEVAEHFQGIILLIKDMAQLVSDEETNYDSAATEEKSLDSSSREKD